MKFNLTEEQADIITDAMSVYLNECYTDMEEMNDQEHKEFYQKVIDVYQDFQKQWGDNEKSVQKDVKYFTRQLGLSEKVCISCSYEHLTSENSCLYSNFKFGLEDTEVLDF